MIASRQAATSPVLNVCRVLTASCKGASHEEGEGSRLPSAGSSVKTCQVMTSDPAARVPERPSRAKVKPLATPPAGGYTRMYAARKFAVQGTVSGALTVRRFFGRIRENHHPAVRRARRTRQRALPPAAGAPGGPGPAAV